MTTPDTRPTIAPQVGKRYVRRDGLISGVLTVVNGYYSFWDATEKTSYLCDGREYNDRTPRCADLVAEYVEPGAEPPRNGCATTQANSARNARRS